jgi:hypothetical protein
VVADRLHSIGSHPCSLGMIIFQLFVTRFSGGENLYQSNLAFHKWVKIS